MTPPAAGAERPRRRSWQRPLTRGAAPILAASILLLLAAHAGGCRRDGPPRAISAELVPAPGDGAAARTGERVQVVFDRPLPAAFRPEEVEVYLGPPRTRLLARALPQKPGARVLWIELLSTPPGIKTSGTFGGNPDLPAGPSGLGIDLGRAAPGLQWVDLQPARVFPRLLAVVWEDRPPPGAPGGDLAVDQGDVLVLSFDRPVKLAAPPAAADGSAGEPAALPARVPADILLTKSGDALDDGKTPAVFEEGSNLREVLVVLGSNPRLTPSVERRPAGPAPGSGPGSSYWPSGMALNGTPVQPSRAILDRATGAGAISQGSVSIELPKASARFEKGPLDSFPPPGHRADHTVTPLAGGRALIVGGRTCEAVSMPIAQVLLFDPDAPQPFTQVGTLPDHRYLHTATLFPGEDGIPGTLDDFVLIAGGTDGRRSLGSLVAIRLDPASPGAVTVEPVDSPLRLGRMYHTATLLPPDRLLLEGGSYVGPGGDEGILPTAEVLGVRVRGGRVTARVEEEVQVLPRMRHTSTYLGPAPDGADYVLSYGGFGPPRPQEWTPGPPLLNPGAGAVLAAPTLLRIPPRTGTARRPDGEPAARQLPPLDYEYRFEMLRYDHAAVPLFGPQPFLNDGFREVFIAGGSLEPLNFDRNTPLRYLFELPHRGQDLQWIGRRPTYQETAAAVVFEFHPRDPSGSVFRVLESPTGERRAHFAAVALAYPGVLLLGGENPRQPDEVHATCEVYLPRETRFLPLAVPLACARSRAGAYAVEQQGGVTVHVLGGAPAESLRADFADWERLRIEWR